MGARAGPEVEAAGGVRAGAGAPRSRPRTDLEAEELAIAEDEELSADDEVDLATGDDGLGVETAGEDDDSLSAVGAAGYFRVFQGRSSLKARDDGAVAQLGERRNGIAEVRGSIPLGSTILRPPEFIRVKHRGLI